MKFATNTGKQYFDALYGVRDMLANSRILRDYCYKLVSDETFGSIKEIEATVAVLWNPKTGVNGLVYILEQF